jgi:hypothetical protein
LIFFARFAAFAVKDLPSVSCHGQPAVFIAAARLRAAGLMKVALASSK